MTFLKPAYGILKGAMSQSTPGQLGVSKLLGFLVKDCSHLKGKGLRASHAAGADRQQLQGVAGQERPRRQR